MATTTTFLRKSLEVQPGKPCLKSGNTGSLCFKYILAVVTQTPRTAASYLRELWKAYQRSLSRILARELNPLNASNDKNRIPQAEALLVHRKGALLEASLSHSCRMQYHAVNLRAANVFQLGMTAYQQLLLLPERRSQQPQNQETYNLAQFNGQGNHNGIAQERNACVPVGGCGV